MGIHTQRKLAFQAMFMYGFNTPHRILISKEDILNNFFSSVNSSDAQFAIKLFCCTIDNLAKIDTIIKKSINKDFHDTINFELLSITLLSILRIACAELMYLTSTEHKALVIDEAIIIAKIYAENNTYKIVHAILDKIIIPTITNNSI